MKKYEPLKNYLSQRDDEILLMTFEEIEDIIDAKLPSSAKSNTSWWHSNLMRSIGIIHSLPWLNCGFKPSQIDFEDRKLIFRRYGTAALLDETFENEVNEYFFRHFGLNLSYIDHNQTDIDFISRKNQTLITCAKVLDEAYVKEFPEQILDESFAAFENTPRGYRKILVIENTSRKTDLMSASTKMENHIEHFAPPNFELWEFSRKERKGTKIWPTKTATLQKPNEILSNKQMKADRKAVASDRYVSFSDNRPNADEAINKFYELADEIADIHTNEYQQEKKAILGDINISISIMQQDTAHAEPALSLIQNALLKTEEFINRASALAGNTAKAVMLVVAAYQAVRFAFGL